MRKENLFYWLVFVVFCASFLVGCDQTNVASSTVTGTSAVSDVSSSDVKVYQGTGDYRAPSGQEAYLVKISTNKGVVTDVSAVTDTQNDNSLEYQSLFLEGVKSNIIGKSLKDLKALDRVNGASLTTNGFNKALAEIQASMKS